MKMVNIKTFLLYRMSVLPEFLQRRRIDDNIATAQRQRSIRLPNVVNNIPSLQRLRLDLGLHRFFTFPYIFEQETKLKRVDLANSGLFLSDCKQLLACYFCSGEIEVSTLDPGLSGDNIDIKHQELNPWCPLFKESTENVPLVPSNCSNYKFEACRLFSLLLVDWKAPVSIYDLAHFGFFYANSEDNARCAFCRLEVRGWEPLDTAEEEHRRWNPNCPFLKLQDVGNVPIGDELYVSSSLHSLTGISSIMKCKIYFKTIHW
jgi:Inhibitor of Apoptosis domain